MAKGLAVRVEFPGSCNMAGSIADVRRVLAPRFSEFKLSVICLDCAAVQVEGGEAEEHEPGCPTACELCTTEPPRQTGPHDT